MFLIQGCSFQALPATGDARLSFGPRPLCLHLLEPHWNATICTGEFEREMGKRTIGRESMSVISMGECWNQFVLVYAWPCIQDQKEIPAFMEVQLAWVCSFKGVENHHHFLVGIWKTL
jgi:hypothetical protein